MDEKFSVSSQEGLVKKHFENNADLWQQLYSTKDLQSRIVQERFEYTLQFLDQLKLPENSRGIDIGCGAGLTCVELLKRNISVVGLDVSQNMVVLARKNCPNFSAGCKAEFLIGSAEEMDFANDSFDIVTALGLLEYLRWDQWALSEIHRILKPDGYLIVSVPNSLRLSNLTNPVWLGSKIKRKLESIFIGVAAKVLGGRARAKVENFFNQYLHLKTDSDRPRIFERRLYRRSYFDDLLNQHSFKIVKKVSHGYGPFFLLRRCDKLGLALNAFFGKLFGLGLLSGLSKYGNDYLVLCQKVKKPSFQENIGRLSKERVLGEFVNRNKVNLSRLEAWTVENRIFSPLWKERKEIDTSNVGNIVVLSPHPDDETIGCGGTLLRFQEGGSRVAVIQLTDGSDTKALSESVESVRKTIRLEEAEVVSDLLGFSELILWKEKASSLEPTPENVEWLTVILNRLKPEAIFVPFINDLHPDHVAANKILVRSLQKAAIDLENTRIFSYEVWSLVPVNSYCRINSQMEQKAHALWRYRTAMKVVDYVSFCDSLNSYHSCKILGEMGYVEAFFSCTATDYLKIADSVSARADTGGRLSRS